MTVILSVHKYSCEMSALCSFTYLFTKAKNSNLLYLKYVPRPLHVSHIHGHGSCATGCSAANVLKVSDPVEQPHLLSKQTSVLFVVKMAASVGNMQARPVQTSSTVMALNSLQC